MLDKKRAACLDAEDISKDEESLDEDEEDSEDDLDALLDELEDEELLPYVKRRYSQLIDNLSKCDAGITSSSQQSLEVPPTLQQ